MGHTEIGNKNQAPSSDSHNPTPPLPTPSTPPTPKMPPTPAPPNDFRPQWKAEFFISMKLGHEKEYKNVLTLGDTGSTRCTISEDFYRNSPALRGRPYRPLTTRGKAINGTKVLTVGIVSVPFRINKVHMTINCRVVRGLIQPIILGWDFFSKFNAKLNATDGLLEFRDWAPIPLVKDTPILSGCFYRVHEDTVIPANSVMHKRVELMADKDHIKRASKVVLAEPFSNNGSDVWTSRVASEVRDCMFLTEFMNTSKEPVKLEAGRVLGYADFSSPEEMDKYSWQTEMYNTYKNEPSPPANKAEDPENDDEMEEIICDPPPTTRPEGKNSSESRG